MALAGGALWVARPHLRDIWRKVRTGTDEIDDSDEILSYRQAVTLLAVSTLTMTAWLLLAGMDWWLAPAVVLAAFGLMFGLTRIVAEGGLAVTKAPLVAADMAVAAWGGSALGRANLGSLGMSLSWAGDLRVTLMAAVIHGLRLAEQYVGSHRRRLSVAILIAVIVGASAAVATVLLAGYRHGGMNLSSWFFGRGSATAPYDFVSYHLTNPAHARWELLGVAGLGAAAQLLLMVASKHFLWFPIHPGRLPGERHVDDPPPDAEHLRRLAGEGRGPALWRGAAVPEHEALLPRPDPRPLRHRRTVVRHRRLHGHDGQHAVLLVSRVPASPVQPGRRGLADDGGGPAQPVATLCSPVVARRPGPR